MTLDEKLIACLERIAFNTSPRNLDFAVYVKDVVYGALTASRQPKPTPKKGDKKA